MGTPLVSGIKKYANRPITTIQPTKKKKIPACMLHSIDKKACAIKNVKNMLQHTANANPEVLVSTGKVSLGISQPSGPHDHANPITKAHTQITTIIASALSSDPSGFKSFNRITPMIPCLEKKKTFEIRFNSDEEDFDYDNDYDEEPGQ